MPEHLLFALIDDDNFNSALNIFYSPQVLAEKVEEFLEQMEKVPDDVEYEPEVSAQMSKVIESAVQDVASSSAEALDTPHLVRGILRQKESWAAYLLKDTLYNKEANFMSQLINFCEFDDNLQNMKDAGGENQSEEG
jgi:ATP-dependent Clp protease ATP-binding subunit ClpA